MYLLLSLALIVTVVAVAACHNRETVAPPPKPAQTKITDYYGATDAIHTPKPVYQLQTDFQLV